jgi:signal peptidase I
MDDPTQFPSSDHSLPSAAPAESPWSAPAEPSWHATPAPTPTEPVAASGEIPVTHAFTDAPHPLVPSADAVPVDGAIAIPAPAGAAVDRPVPFHWGRVVEELVAWFKTLFSAAVYATLIVTFGFQVARVEGQSMAPTLEDQDRLIVNKLAYQIGDPQVGDIVMLHYPVDPTKSFVKRVVGEPNDTLRSIDGRVYRNDVPLPDDFIPEEFRSHDTWGPRVVPDGYYFVMGDHRNNSSDSRSWDYVPKLYILGKVQIRWWPVSHAHFFEPWH